MKTFEDIAENFTAQMAAAYEKLLQFWQEKATTHMRAAAQDFVAVLTKESNGKDEFQRKLAELDKINMLEEMKITEFEADNRLKRTKIAKLEAALEKVTLEK